MFVSKPGASGPADPDQWCGGLKVFAERRPALAEYLTLTKYPDGSDRIPSTMIVLIEAGRFKVCLSDRDLSRSLWITGDSLDSCLASLDEELQLGTADWRRSGGSAGRGKK